MAGGNSCGVATSDTKGGGSATVSVTVTVVAASQRSFCGCLCHGARNRRVTSSTPNTIHATNIHATSIHTTSIHTTGIVTRDSTADARRCAC